MHCAYLSGNDYDEAVGIIRSAYSGDADAIQAFFDEDFLPSFQHSAAGAKHHYRFCGAFVDGQLVGIGAFALSFQTDKVWELAWGTVHPDHQGQGVGRALLDFRCQEIVKHKYTDEVYATVHSRPSSLFLDNGFQTSLISDDRKSLMWKRLL